MSDTDRSTELVEEPDCRFCGDPVDPLQRGHYKTPGDKFAHPECVADHCYDHREKVATDEGVFRIESVKIMKTVGHKEQLLDSYWQAECPVCYLTHETESHSEDVRTDFIDEVCECCGAEWMPPSDWIEDCEICGTSHRESRDCEVLSMRKPFPDPDEHRYECSKCDWSGEGDEFGNPDGYCPECDTAAVRAVEVATDGGVDTADSESHGIVPEGFDLHEARYQVSTTDDDARARCPACYNAGVIRRSPGICGVPDDAHLYRCANCKHRFDEPVTIAEMEGRE